MGEYVGAHELALQTSLKGSVEDTVALKVEQFSALSDRVDPLNLTEHLVEPAPLPSAESAEAACSLPLPTAEDIYREHARAGAVLHGNIRAELSMVDMGITSNIAHFAARVAHYLAEYEVSIGSVRNNNLPPF